MFFLVIVAAFLCSSITQASESIIVSYPDGLTESVCSGFNSWTEWFNTAKPSDNRSNRDQETLLAIRQAYGRDICTIPRGMQATSVGDISNFDLYPGSWLLMDKFIAGFHSNIPDLDFQVRFCCYNVPTESTTRAAITPQPVTNDTCGRAEIKHSLTSRIFGGSYATPNSWPWQVLYEEQKPCAEDYICIGVCGGTLIDSLHVLTAAHCIGTTNQSLITIKAGLHNQNHDESDTRQFRTVEHIFIHPDYKGQTLENDIAILRLTEPVLFSKYVQPACLPGPEPQPDDDVILVGWGSVKEGEAPHHELKQTKVKVIGNCNQYWGQSVDERKQVCVGHRISGDSVCSGDSGGPMLYEHNGQWFVSGVTSFTSRNSCSEGANFVPNVYARVSAYLPWINSII